MSGIGRLPLLFGDRRGEIRVFFGDPIDKFANIRVSQKALHIHAVSLKFGIGKIGHQRLLANGVHRHCLAPTTAFGNRMVQHNSLAQWPAAKPANNWRALRVVFAIGIAVGVMFRMPAGHGST